MSKPTATELDRSGAFELAAPVGPADHVLGPADAAVTVVEYSDFECPRCKQAAPAVKLLFTRFARQVRFVYRHFPVEANHPHAMQAAEAAESADTQGKFWQMHDLLFENQSNLQRGDLSKYASLLGLDVSRFEKQVDEHLHLPTVREHLSNGQKSGVRSTPAFFVNGRIQDVSYSMQSLIDAIDSAVKAG